jgi:WD40 repeat protein
MFTFTEHAIPTTADAPFSVFGADVDGDGDTDVLSASWENDTIAWYENDGECVPPVFTEHEIWPSADGAWSVFAVDVDGDGDMDVLSASEFDDTIAWYESDGAADPTFLEHEISTTRDFARSVFGADVDGDGDVDVLAASSIDGTVAWYDNDGGSPPTFTERVISAARDFPSSVFAADVDGDGRTDVITASQGDDTIKWFENGSVPTANAPFAEQVVSTAADQAISVHAEDVDGDGDVDLVSASLLDQTIAWYENDGGSPPGFTERVVTDQASNPYSVHAADIDEDGDMDLLSAAEGDDKIAWYESDGGSPPAFTERDVEIMALGAHSVFPADVDGDGDIDVVAAVEGEDMIAWYESDGLCPLPGFTERVVTDTALGATSAIAVDVDADGRMDIIAASHFDDQITLHWNDGPGPVFLPIPVSVARDAPRTVFAADVDGDGDVDVLSASENDDTIAWHENDGASPPGFSEHLITTERDGAHGVFAADVDGDGDVDVISASYDDDTVAWYENDGPPLFTFTEHVLSTGAEGARAVSAADVDGDGDVDVLAASLDDDTIALYDNGRTDIVLVPVELLAAGEATYVAVGNLDTESVPGPLPGTLDAVVLIPDVNPLLPGRAQVFRNPEGANPAFFTGADPTGVDVGFFDGDLYLDLAVANATDGTVAVHPNDGSDSAGFPNVQEIFSLRDSRPTAIATARFNDDAFDDLAVAFDGDGMVRILVGDGNLNFTVHDDFLAGVGMASLRPGDLDNDRDFDVVVTSREENMLILGVLNDGMVGQLLSLPSGDRPVELALGDLDDNGFLDIVSADSGDATLSVIMNNGGLDFAPRFTLRTGDNPVSVHMEDLDGDDDLDLAVVVQDEEVGPVQVFENLTFGGAGSAGGGALFFADPMSYSVLADPNFVSGGDFNMDGVSDLVTANADDGGTGGSLTVLIADPPDAACGAEDIDGDGIVGFSDLLIVLSLWGPCPGCPEDLDGDGVVGFSDLLAVLSLWGPCG